MAKQSYSLYELNEYIKRVMALNFSEPIWINCEIAQIKEARGNYYLELVEQDDLENTKAQISAAIWYKSYLFIKNKLGVLTNTLLAPGTHVQIKAQVDFNERYGLKLIIEDIDPSYTLGKLELARQNILERLNKEGVTNLNKELSIPSVIQRIAIISSETAAGYQDFINQCTTNSYGYQYELTLFQAALQGQNTEREVCAALDTIKERSDQFDAIVIIRGGGSKIDLSFFDNFNIGYKIATSPLPVFTGIGHEIDNSIADLMANASLKTPTAVADYIVEKTVHFESSIVEMSQRIFHLAKQNVRQSELRLQNLEHSIFNIPRYILADQTHIINKAVQLIESISFNKISILKNKLESIDQLINSYDPVFILKKGYVTLTQNGKYIGSKKELKKEEFEITFVDGQVKAIQTEK